MNLHLFKISGCKNNQNSLTSLQVKCRLIIPILILPQAIKVNREFLFLFRCVNFNVKNKFWIILNVQSSNITKVIRQLIDSDD